MQMKTLKSPFEINWPLRKEILESFLFCMYLGSFTLSKWVQLNGKTLQVLKNSLPLRLWASQLWCKIKFSESLKIKSILTQKDRSLSPRSSRRIYEHQTVILLTLLISFQDLFLLFSKSFCLKLNSFKLREKLSKHVCDQPAWTAKLQASFFNSHAK